MVSKNKIFTNCLLTSTLFLVLLLSLSGINIVSAQTNVNSANDNDYALDRVIACLKVGPQLSTDNFGIDSPIIESVETLMDIKSNEQLFTGESSRVNKKIVLIKLNGKGEQIVETAINTLKDNPDVVYVEPDYTVYANSIIPDDTYFDNLYGMINIQAPEAWEINKETEVAVAVIDTGIDYNHPDLADNIWINPGEVLNNYDDDNNGYIDDIHGWDFYNNDNNPMDGASHGTHVSGTIGAVGNNNRGVVGVAWDVKLVALKFLSDSGSGNVSDAVEAINYARNMDILIANNSWGGYGYSQALKNAIAAYDGLFIAAAGNDDFDTDVIRHYPSSYDLPNIISVAASNQYDDKAYFSNYGDISVDLAAPGVDILSTIPGSSYGYASGTSMATPHVTGAAALIKDYNPVLSNDLIKRAILNGVDTLTSFNNQVLTGGRLNVYNSLRLAGTYLADAVPILLENTPEAQASDIYSSTYQAWNAFDGNDITGGWTMWISSITSSTTPKWISYTFPVPINIIGYYILPQTGNLADRTPRDWYLQGSNDGTNWTTLDSRSGITIDKWDIQGKYFKISTDNSSINTKFKIYRLYVNSTNGSPVVSIRQLKLLLPDSIIPVMTSNTQPSGIVEASSIYSNSYLPWKAFDDNDSVGGWTLWISSITSSTSPKWISYDFGKNTTISGYYILPQTGNLVDRAPLSWELQALNSNNQWVTIDTRNNITMDYWTNTGLYFPLSTSVTYSKYRLYITETNGSEVVSIRQIKFFD